MNLPPRPPKENLFAGGLIQRIIITGILLAISALFVQWWTVREGYDVLTQQTAVFTTLCFVQLGNALSVRSTYHSLFSKDIFANRSMWLAVTGSLILQLLIVYVSFLDTVFKTTPLDGNVMLMIVVTTVASVILIELVKLLNKRMYLKK